MLDYNKAIISAWCSTRDNDINEEYCQKVRECGLNLILTNGMNDSARINELLTLCDKYDISAYVYDTRCYVHDKGLKAQDIDLDALFAPVKDYAHHESFAGIILHDEPGTNGMAYLETCRQAFLRLYPDKEPFINLIPMYANAGQLQFGAGADAIDYYDADQTLYREHLAEYAKRVTARYLCVDIYPCRMRDGVEELYDGYLQNINLCARQARESGLDLWIMMQSMGWDGDNINGMRYVDETDMRFQYFCFMAFGVTNFSHFCYHSPWERDSDHGMVDVSGRPRNTYYYGRRIHGEIRRLENVYLAYKNVGAYNVSERKELPYMHFSEQFAGFDGIRVTCDEPLTVGCFEKKVGAGKALAIVNMTDLHERKTVEARIYTDAELTAYPAGVPMKLGREADGGYRLVLPCGEGMFVTAE